MPAQFITTRRVEFADTDMAGIIHFANYYRYMEEAEHAMWRAAGLSIHDPADAHGWDLACLDEPINRTKIDPEVVQHFFGRQKMLVAHGPARNGELGV